MLSIGCFVYTEKQDNPFYESEKNAEVSSSTGEFNNDTKVIVIDGNPPGENELNVNANIPLLLVAAVGIIIYTAYPKRNILF